MCLFDCVQQYEFTSINETECKRNLAKLFKQHQNVSLPEIKEMLLAKGEMEFDETIRMHKTPCHILKVMTTDIDEKLELDGGVSSHEYAKLSGGSGFMSDFYQGK